jgi:hypothetical protein
MDHKTLADSASSTNVRKRDKDEDSVNSPDDDGGTRSSGPSNLEAKAIIKDGILEAKAIIKAGFRKVLHTLTITLS